MENFRPVGMGLLFLIISLLMVPTFNRVSAQFTVQGAPMVH